jgi:N utilization substance protein A
VFVDEDSRALEIVVADDQLSLAIGKRGQNVSLAARLTGCRIDIKSESKAAEAELQDFSSYDGTSPGSEEALEEAAEGQVAEESTPELTTEVAEVAPEATPEVLIPEASAEEQAG